MRKGLIWFGKLPFITCYEYPVLKYLANQFLTDGGYGFKFSHVNYHDYITSCSQKRKNQVVRRMEKLQ